MTTPWTETICGRVRELVAANYSASQVAAALNKEFRTSFSRNAIIGKVLRDKLGRFQNRFPGRPAAARAVKHHQPEKRTPRPRAKRILLSPGTNFEVVEANFPMGEAPPVDDLGIPECQRRTILTLTGSTCRWPVGDPSAPDFFFCGGPIAAGEVYCPGHCRRAYEAPKQRRGRAFFLPVKRREAA